MALLDMGVDPTALDNELNAPLHYAAESGNIEMAKLLIDTAPDVMNQLNLHHMNPLTIACEEDDADMVRLFLTEGAKIQPQTVLLANKNESSEILSLLFGITRAEQWETDSTDFMYPPVQSRFLPSRRRISLA